MDRTLVFVCFFLLFFQAHTCSLVVCSVFVHLSNFVLLHQAGCAAVSNESGRCYVTTNCLEVTGSTLVITRA